MARGLEDFVRGQRGAVHLEHVLLEDEVLAPDVCDVGEERAAWGAEVVETADATINLERGSVEHAPPQHGVKDGLVEGLTLQCGCRHVGLRDVFPSVDLYP